MKNNEGPRLRHGLSVLLTIAARCGSCVSGCDRAPSSHESPPRPTAQRSPSAELARPLSTTARSLSPPLVESLPPPTNDARIPSPIRFRDATESSGIDFQHSSGNSPEKEFPTCLGSGVALLDYDGDGWLDIYLATTRNLPLDAPDRSRGNRLYRNRRDGTFEDVTVRARRRFSWVLPRRGGRRREQRRRSRPLPGQPGSQRALSQQRRRHVPRCHGQSRTCKIRVVLRRGVPRLRQRRQARPLRHRTTANGRPTAPRPYCGDQTRNLRTICSPTTIEPQRHSSVSQPRRRNLRGRHREGRSELAGTVAGWASSPPT